MHEKVFISGHPGMGDHILCNGLYRSFAADSSRVIVSAVKTNYKQVRLMLNDLSNVCVLPYGSHSLYPTWVSAHAKYLGKFGFEWVGLGDFGEAFVQNTRFDESFYLQAKVDFDKRWSLFNHPRRNLYENELYRLLLGDRIDANKIEPYVFLHEDVERGYLVNRQFIKDKKLKIVSPLTKLNKFSIFDYRKIIEGATEIHCIESSFAAYIESIQESVCVPKFAHRYARPEAKSNWKLEFTYRSTWSIID